MRLNQIILLNVLYGNSLPSDFRHPSIFISKVCCDTQLINGELEIKTSFHFSFTSGIILID